MTEDVRLEDKRTGAGVLVLPSLQLALVLYARPAIRAIPWWRRWWWR